MEEGFSLERLKNELAAAEARLAGARSRKAAAEAELASKTSERDRASADAEAALDEMLPSPLSSGAPQDIEPILEKSHAAETEYQKAAIAFAQASAEIGAAESDVNMAKIELEAGEAIEAHLASSRDELLAVANAALARSAHRRRTQARQNVKWGLVLFVASAGALSIGGGALYLVLRKPTPVTPVIRMKGEPLGLDASSAQVFCAENIKRVAKDPETAKIPYVSPQNRPDTHEFIWGPSTSMVRMRNGLGLEVAVQASCSVSKSTGKIITLIVDGTRVIPGM